MKNTKKILVIMLILSIGLVLFGCTQENSREAFSGIGKLSLHAPEQADKTGCVGTGEWVSFDYNIGQSQFMYGLAKNDNYTQFIGRAVNITGDLVTTSQALCIPFLPCDTRNGCLTLEVKNISEIK